MTSCHIVSLEKLNETMPLKWQAKHLTHTCAVNIGSLLLLESMQRQGCRDQLFDRRLSDYQLS